MCTLLLQIAMLIDGIYIIITGNAWFTDRLKVKGWPARIVGLILLAPIPLTILIIVALSFLIRTGTLPYSTRDSFSFLDLPIAIGCMLIALAFMSLSRQSSTS